MSEKTFILARRFDQFRDYLISKDLNRRDFIYLNEARKLMGAPRGQKVIRIADWYKRPRIELNGIESMIKARECLVSDDDY